MAKAQPAFVANLDTTVPVSRSVDQIRAMVERFRAREFRTVYNDDGRPVAVRFTITEPNLSPGGDHDGVFTVELAAPSDLLFSQINGKRKASRWNFVDRDRAQAERVAWRQVHDIIRASLIAVSSGVMTLGEAFFANLVVTAPGGEELRMAQVLTDSRLLTASNGRLMLGAGS